jgi:predicted small lipoprotein YifL
MPKPEKKLTKRLIALLAVFSLSGCGTLERPDSNVGVVNAPLRHLKYYNLKTDYDSNGILLPGAVAKFKTLQTLDDLNKYICMDPNSFANLKAFLNELKQRATCEVK